MFDTNSKTKLYLVLALTTVMGLSACAKKATGIKAQVKTEQSNLNPAVSSSADQQAANLNANYKIYSVSTPNDSTTSTGYTVDVQLQSPSGELLPVTTHHEGGNLDSQGTYTDSQRNLQVYVQARCSSDECFKYILLVTVTRNNQAVYQSLAISYKYDCKFNIVSSSGTIGEFYSSLNAAASSKYSYVTPRNDIDTCSN